MEFAPFSRKNPALAGDLEVGACEGGGAALLASRGHGRCGARWAVRPPHTQGRQAQSAAAQRQEPLR